MRAAIPLERGPVLQLLIRLTCKLFDTKPLLPLIAICSSSFSFKS